MNTKKLQLLISAGVFSAALLSGAAYADETSADTSKVQVSSGTTDAQDQPAASDSKQKTTAKNAAHHDCATSGGCASDK